MRKCLIIGGTLHRTFRKVCWTENSIRHEFLVKKINRNSGMVWFDTVTEMYYEQKLMIDGKEVRVFSFKNAEVDEKLVREFLK